MDTIYTKKSNTPTARERFKSEYISMTSLRKRITPECYDKLFPKYNKFYYKKDGYAYLDMEYVNGETLASILKRNATAPSSCVLLLEPYKVRRLYEQISAAHQYLLEEGMLYLDINPNNIIITDTTKFSIKIVDFTDIYYLKREKNNYKIISSKLNPNASLPLQLRDSAMTLFSMLFSSANMEHIQSCYGGRYRALFPETNIPHTTTILDTRDLLVLWNEWCNQLRLILLHTY